MTPEMWEKLKVKLIRTISDVPDPIIRAHYGSVLQEMRDIESEAPKEPERKEPERVAMISEVREMIDEALRNARLSFVPDGICTEQSYPVLRDATECMRIIPGYKK